MRLSSSRGISVIVLPSITTECSTSLWVIVAFVADRSERADEAVDDPRVASDHHRPADSGVDDLGAGGDHDATVEAGCGIDTALDARLDLLQQQPVRLEQWRQLAGVDPPPVEPFGPHAVTTVDQPLDGIGDLQLTARPTARWRRRQRGSRSRRDTRRRGRGSTADRRASRRAVRHGRRRRGRRCRTDADRRPP